MTFAPTNTEMIVPKLPEAYEDAYTKDVPHLVKLAYKPQDVMFNYEPVLPNRPMGEDVVEEVAE